MTESFWVRIGLRVPTVAVGLPLPAARHRRHQCLQCERLQAWPPAGFTLAGSSTALETRRSGGARELDPCGGGCRRDRPRARDPGRDRRAALSLLRARPCVPAGVAHRAAGRGHRDRAAVDLPDRRVGFGLFTIIVGHATFCVVIAYNNVIARLRRLPRIAGGSLRRSRGRHLDHLQANHHAGDGDRPAVRRAARIRPLLRRGHRDELHGRAGNTRRFRCGSSPRSSARPSCRW